MGRKFAQGTNISVSQTIADAQAMVARYGGDRFLHMTDPNIFKGYFLFEFRGYKISFGFEYGPHQKERQRMYRSGLLQVKAKLESVASGIESPAQAFFAHIIGEDGQLVFDKAKHLLPKVKDDKDKGVDGFHDVDAEDFEDVE